MATQSGRGLDRGKSVIPTSAFQKKYLQKAKQNVARRTKSDIGVRRSGLSCVINFFYGFVLFCFCLSAEFFLVCFKGAI